MVAAPSGIVPAPTLRIHETADMRVTNLVGLEVYNGANESLGTIENLIVAPTSGKITYAILCFGDSVGMGEKLAAIPWGELTLAGGTAPPVGTPGVTHFVLDLPQDVIARAPVFEREHWPNFADRRWNVEIDQYYMTQRQARLANRQLP